MSAEPPFTAHAFAIELRLPGEGEPLCEAAFCERVLARGEIGPYAFRTA